MIRLSVKHEKLSDHKSLAFKMSSTMNSREIQREMKCSNTSPRRISRGSQTPKKKSKIRNEKNEHDRQA